MSLVDFFFCQFSHTFPYLYISLICFFVVVAKKINIESNPYQESINSRKPVLSYKEKNNDPIDTAPISLRTRGVSAPRDGIIKGTPGTLSPKVTSLPPTTEVIHLEKDALLEAVIAASLRTLTFPAFRIKLVDQVQKVTLVPMKV
ncbi:hypothetical protein POPTR_008G206100v4 [Populus trichocarpa]|jgi:hypothetical protein|uniref:Photosystem II CP43 chlorophyll apoprotein n=1 Tax=Populus trichocarpa TaxID=3694 RepID=A0A2K1ZKU2_POPTR|nr:hypothetical protein POPTR_008G206100v4 [Populus trichocarpa]